MDTAPYVDVRVTQRYSASADRVFDAWLDPGIAGQWLFATATRPVARVEIDARAGGSFRFVEREDGGNVEHTGEYVEIVPPRRLVFTLALKNGSRDVTRVTAEIVPLRKGCELALVHEKVALEHASRTEGRWAGMLYGLGVTLGRSDR